MGGSIENKKNNVDIIKFSELIKQFESTCLIHFLGGGGFNRKKEK